jgi:DNA-binding HxlR family transcriptional regulator
MKFDELIDEPCSISRALSVLGDRWTLVVLKQAFAGTRRFEEFQSSIGISRGRLADRLARLVSLDLLEQVEYFDNRTRNEYRLTEKGIDAYPILLALRDWGDAHLSPNGPPLSYQHRDCGGNVEVEIRCVNCGDRVTARDVIVEIGPGFNARKSNRSRK